MSERVARRLVIHGRVQGVWFRESMRIEADALGVAGWVRNRPDGTVEAHVEGPADEVERIVRWAHRGPESARVTGVDQTDAPVAGHPRFEKRPTG
ncbi:MAG TPA: acylphosphatase [Usitatibacter sp.]|nr:acylphosphatase [Usitatibacter sp.]